MRKFFPIPGTPLFAAFFVMAPLIMSCGPDDSIVELSQAACEQPFTVATDIQGNGDQSALLNELLSTRGIVTHVEPASGVFIEHASDANGQASAGLFIQAGSLASLAKRGDLLVVEGSVTELGEGSDTLTSLTAITGYRVCASGQSIPVTRISLPLTKSEREALEGMNLEIEQDLFVTDPRNGGAGLLTLSRDGILPIPTEVARPGPDARAQALKNSRASLRIRLDERDDQLFPAGTTILSAQGVLGHDGRGLRLLQNDRLRTIPIRVNRIAPPAGQDLRVIGLNLHNYFNGDGQGGQFPTPRGAETPAEFAAQRARLAATIEHIGPHLVAVMELENDGFGDNSAAADFIRDLESATGETWQAVQPFNGPIGGDAITVGLFYRPDRLAAAGRASVLNGPEFQRLSRVPLAEHFTDQNTGQSFLTVVNHLKSKGSCPEDGRNANMKDGQGCWNPARTAAAKVMAEWTAALAASVSDGKALILGDINAYRMEDPITAIRDAGFHDLNAASGIGFGFSLMYSGQAGTLDYAFASSALRPFVQSAMVPNFNSPYARELELPLPWLGASDHDPVLVDLRFRQASTSN